MGGRRSCGPALALSVALLVAGCGGGTRSEAPVEPPPPAAERQPQVPAPFATDPGPSLIRFVDAAGSGRAKAMWDELSRATRRRLGPTLEEFRTGAAQRLEAGVGSFARGRYRVILDEPISLAFAVVAIAGEREVGGMRKFAAFGAALRFEGGRWRVELRGRVKIRPIRPNPGEAVRGRTQLAADVAARAPIEEAGIWFDGVAFQAKGGRTDAMHLGMWGEAPQPLANGWHTVVAFASAGRDAGALAWMFTVRGGVPRGGGLQS